MAAVTIKLVSVPPLMHVFRAAHEAKDANKKLDLRDEAGDRIIAGRRLPARQVDHRADLATGSRRAISKHCSTPSPWNRRIE